MSDALYGLSQVMVGVGILCGALPGGLWLIGLLPEPSSETLYGPAGDWCRANRRKLGLWAAVFLPVLLIGGVLNVLTVPDSLVQ